MNNSIFERISYHTVYDNNIIDALEFVTENCFTGIQVAVESPHLTFENLSSRERTEIRQRSKELGIRISLHGPDDVTSLLQTNPHIRKGILSYYSDLFTFAEEIEAILVTIHIGYPIMYKTDTIPSEKYPEIDIPFYTGVLEENLESINNLGNNMVDICIENYFLEGFVLQILDKYLYEGKLGLCWDIAKTYNKDCSINEQLQKYFYEYRYYIKQVHLHDMNNDGSSHRTIGTGIIDFKKHLEQISDVEVLDYCIEVRPGEKAVESLNNLRNILQT